MPNRQFPLYLIDINDENANKCDFKITYTKIVFRACDLIFVCMLSALCDSYIDMCSVCIIFNLFFHSSLGSLLCVANAGRVD